MVTKQRPVGIVVVAAVLAIVGVLGLLGGLALIFGGAGIAQYLASMTEGAADIGSGALGGIIGVLGFVSLVMAIVALAAAWGVWNEAAWGRIVATIVSVLWLLSFPIGTLLGVLNLFFLWFHDKTKRSFA